MGHVSITATGPPPLPPSPSTLIERERDSNRASSGIQLVPKIVMAEQVTNDVVKEAQSMGRPTPIDATATTTNNFAGDGEATSSLPNAQNNPQEAFSTSTNATNADTALSKSTRALEKDGANAVTANLAPKEARERLVNGDSAEHSASESQPTLGDASGGSDTDISRPGSVDQAKRAAGHLRSNSVKKPASFKSVSVTKNFLAKSAVAAPAIRPGEKATPSGQVNASTLQTARPRLVAKSGAGNVHRSLSTMNGAGSGPDASKVWNKNQPVPPPPPKQFTDEELKQQYGIHLATRLQADEAGKEAKWADIDDDEDDWAPDTVQWMDGTKSTVTAVETSPPPAEEPKPEAKIEAPTDTPKPAPASATNSQTQSATGGTKTILKPGAHGQAGPTKTGLVLKGQPEKPTLVAKPSAPTPVKSPWATLPPVEKVSPVQINPPPPQHPQHSPRFSHRDLHGYDAPPALAKEIAPDDFNRSWRDDRGNRELFNSHSGRYEPVNEMRRGSMRDSYRQQPAVLQRPSHEGPAEPSAAFQTSRTSADAPAWGRRRNSSNVSGGTGRRMSIDRRGPDMPSAPMNIQRRESQSINGLENDPRQAFAQKGGLPHPAAADQRGSFTQSASPGLSHVQPVSPFGSVTSSNNLEVATPNAAVPMESAVEAQKRLMAEKLERARLKKQKDLEEEKKAEAEKQERLAKKLAAMGLASDLKPKAKDHSPPRGLERSPQKEKALPAPIQSPPKPPVPTSEGEVAQYGMMKVHQPQPVKKPFHSDAASKSVPKPSASPVKSHIDIHQKSTASTQPPHPATGFNRESERGKPQLDQPEGTISQGLKSSQATPPAWTTTLPQQSRPWTSNVWGPPQTKDRALGNGTFDSGYNRGQPRSGSQQLPTQSPSGSAASIGIAPAPKGPAPQPSNQSFAQQPMYSQTTPLPAAQATATSKPGPIAPPSDKGWGNFAAHIRRDDQETVVKARKDLDRLGGETFRPELRETYKDQQGKAQNTLHDKVAGNAALSEVAVKPKGPPTTRTELKAKDEISKPTHEGSTTQQPMSQGAHLQATTQGPRSSRFFPRPTETAQTSTTSSKTDSPPPPETESHPAFTGDSNHPLVRLPKPSPVVRLPPPAADYVAQPEPPVSMPSRVRLGLGARPLALDPEWQARFNSLLEKAPAATPAPAAKVAAAVPSVPITKGSSLAVAASSKAPLDVRATPKSATVSLPNAVTRKPFVEDGSSEVITRESPEDILLEDREFGSLPIVKPPKVSHLAANEPPVDFPPPYRPQSRWQRGQLDTMTKPAFDVVTVEREKAKDKPSHNVIVAVRLENMDEAITKVLVQRRQGSRRGFGQNKPKRTNTPNATPSGGQNRNSRKPSFQGQGHNSGGSPRSSGSSSWTNSRSTPSNNSNNSSWARRAAAPVH